MDSYAIKINRIEIYVDDPLKPRIVDSRDAGEIVLTMGLSNIYNIDGKLLKDNVPEIIIWLRDRGLALVKAYMDAQNLPNLFYQTHLMLDMGRYYKKTIYYLRFFERLLPVYRIGDYVLMGYHSFSELLRILEALGVEVESLEQG